MQVANPAERVKMWSELPNSMPNGALPDPPPTKPARLYFIDWVRVLAFGLLILFHCAMPFVVFGWEIKNKQQSAVLSSVILWLHQWRLPLLFFIAGAGANFSLARRSWYRFLGERFTRLFIPLWFAILFIIPIQIYFEKLQHGQFSGSYLAFYPSVWTFVPYPEGNLSWSHLWFVAYLFVFNLLMLPVFVILKSAPIRRWKVALLQRIASPLPLLGLAGIFVLIYCQCYIRWPEQLSLLDDWFVFNFSLTLFFLGYFLADGNTFWETCEKWRRHFLALAVVCILYLFVAFWWRLELPKAQNQAFYGYAVLNSIHVWALILAILGFARRHLNVGSAFLRYITPAVYPFYILHQTIIVSSGYFVVQWPIPNLLKFAILAVVCFGSLAFLYHFIIKRSVVTRVLFGVKAS
jgi:glucans biosynthesis protein C